MLNSDYRSFKCYVLKKVYSKYILLCFKFLLAIFLYDRYIIFKIYYHIIEYALHYNLCLDYSVILTFRWFTVPKDSAIPYILCK